MLARIEQRSSNQAQKEVIGESSIRSKVLTSKQLAKTIAELADEKKALEIVILDMRELVNFCDYFVIATGTSSRQVKAIIEGIDDGLSKIGVSTHSSKTFKGFGGVQPGQDVGAWELLDMGDVVVHAFEPQAREFYGLEHLWQDAPMVTYKKAKK